MLQWEQTKNKSMMVLIILSTHLRVVRKELFLVEADRSLKGRVWPLRIYIYL